MQDNISEMEFLKMCLHITESEFRSAKKCKDVERCRKLKRDLKTIKNDIKHMNEKEVI